MANTVRYQTSGSSALKPEYVSRSLTVFEGGARRDGRSSDGTHAAHAQRSHGALLATIAAALAIIGALWAVSVADGLSASTLDARMEDAPHEVVYVQPGDTLWSIASSRAGANTSTERVVSWIMQANDLSGASLTPGTRLVVPVLAP